MKYIYILRQIYMYIFIYIYKVYITAEQLFFLMVTGLFAHEKKYIFKKI